MKPLKISNFRHQERKVLQVSTRELGHGLQTRTAAELASIRGELADICMDEKDDYRRGFLDAIEHLIAGYAAEAKHRAAISEDLATSKLRKNAAKILLALHAGADLPTDIAKHAKLSLPAVSAELKSLREEGFVEQVESEDGQDQRKSPRALSIRGALLARALSQEAVSPTAEAARELAPIYISFIGLLSDQLCLGEQQLRGIATDRLGKTSGAFVFDEFLRHAAEQQLVSVESSVLTLTGPRFTLRWKDVLQSVIGTKRKNAVLEQVKQISTSAEVCFRTKTSIRDECQVAFSEYGMKNVHPWCMEDVRADQIPIPKGQYHIIWSSPDILFSDLNNASLDALLGQASGRHCYASSDYQLPTNIQRLDLDANYVD